MSLKMTPVDCYERTLCMLGMSTRSIAQWVVIFVMGICIVLLFRMYQVHRLSVQFPSTPITLFHEADSILDTCDERACILFDIDNTLIAIPPLLQQSYSGYSSMTLPTVLSIMTRFPSLIIPRNRILLRSSIFYHANYQLLDVAVVSICDSLKARGCTVLGLSRIESGKYGIIPSLCTWKASLLQQLGIHFSLKYPNTVFDTLPRYEDRYPILYEGILCTNTLEKGIVFEAFLDKFRVQPSRIIFFDDEVENLYSVAAVCKKRGISYHLFRCMAYSMLPKLSVANSVSCIEDEMTFFHTVSSSING